MQFKYAVVIAASAFYAINSVTIAQTPAQPAVQPVVQPTAPTVVQPTAQPSGPTVALAGSLGQKALLVVNGGTPRTYSPGQSINGVKLISMSGDQAEVEIAGRRLSLTMGAAASGVSRGAQPTFIAKADGRGHFVASGRVNDRSSVQFMVDTGASMILMSRTDADAAGIAYKTAPRSLVQTANGTATVWRVKLDTITLGEITLNNIDAAVSEAPLPFALLGMTFLNRVEMQRNGDTMTLIKRF